MKITVRLLWIFVALFLMSELADAQQIQVQGLFKGSAVLSIDGKQRMLKAGQRSPEGVLLVSATPKQAVVEIGGEQQILSLTRMISGQYTPAEKREISIRKNNINQYITTATLNGRRMPVLVDTGANAIAMSSRHANMIGLDYQNGIPSRVRTASGEAMSYGVTLRSVDVQGLKVSSVQAFVIEGNYPDTVLLGMSYLQHVDMREQGGILYLKARF